jgi:hypothetical protein
MGMNAFSLNYWIPASFDIIPEYEMYFVNESHKIVTSRGLLEASTSYFA